MFYDSTPPNSEDDDEYPEPGQVEKDTTSDKLTEHSNLDISSIILDKIKSKANHNDFSLTPTPHNGNNSTESNDKKRKMDGEYVESTAKKKKKKHDKNDVKCKKKLKKSKKHKIKNGVESPRDKDNHKKSKKDKKKKKKHKLQSREAVVKQETISDTERNSMNSDITLNSSKLQDMFNYLDEITGIHSDDNCTTNKQSSAKASQLIESNEIDAPNIELSETVMKSQELTASLQPMKIKKATMKEIEASPACQNNSEPNVINELDSRDVSPEPLKEIVNKSIDELSHFVKMNAKHLQSWKRDNVVNRRIPPTNSGRKNSALAVTQIENLTKCSLEGIEYKENSTNASLNSIDEVIDSLLKFDATMECENKDISKSICDPKQDSDSSSSHGSVAEVTFEEIDLQMFESLIIDLPFHPCALHCVETRISAPPTAEQLVQIDALGLEVKKGIYSSDEDSLIRNNWILFCQHHHIPPKPELFVNFKHELNGTIYKLIGGERLKFVQFLANGLNNRFLCSVYKRFQTIYAVLKRGRFTAEEDEHILEVINNTKSKHNIFARLSKDLGRDNLSIEKRFKYLCKQKLNQYNATRVTTKLSEEIIKEFLSAMNFNNVEKLKGITIPSGIMNRVSETLNIREGKLRIHWYTTLHPKLFVVGTRNMCKIKIRLIDLILDDKGAKSSRDIDYKKIIDNMDGWTIIGLRKLLGNMIPKSEFDETSFRSTLKKIKDKFMLDVSNSTYLKVAKYSNGELIMFDPK